MKGLRAKLAVSNERIESKKLMRGRSEGCDIVSQNNEHPTRYTVHCTLCTVHCTILQSVHYSLYNIKFSVYRTLYSFQYTICSLFTCHCSLPYEGCDKVSFLPCTSPLYLFLPCQKPDWWAPVFKQQNTK